MSESRPDLSTAPIRQVHVTGYRAATAYRAKPYHGRATLFGATERPRGIYEDLCLGWGPLVLGGLEIYDTPGHHGAIVREPRARVLVEQLNDALEKAQVRAKARANSDGNESTPSVQNGSDKSSTTLAAAKMAAMLSVFQSSIT